MIKPAAPPTTASDRNPSAHVSVVSGNQCRLDARFGEPPQFAALRNGLCERCRYREHVNVEACLTRFIQEGPKDLWRRVG